MSGKYDNNFGGNGYPESPYMSLWKFHTGWAWLIRTRLIQSSTNSKGI